MNSIRNTLHILGLFGFVTAVGVGFVAYSATHMYIGFCAPSGVWGFVQSLVVMDSTFCQILMGIIHHTQSLYGTILVAFMFSLIGALGKGIAWVSGENTPLLKTPRVIQSRPISLAPETHSTNTP